MLKIFTTNIKTNPTEYYSHILTESFGFIFPTPLKNTINTFQSKMFMFLNSLQLQYSKYYYENKKINQHLCYACINLKRY